MRLHKINHDLSTILWCGPGALATITGLPTSRIMAVLRHVTGRRTVKGVDHGELVRAAQLLGFHLVPQPVYALATENGLPTLARWTATNAHLLAAGAVIFNVSHHYVTVSGRKFNDNWTKVPVPLKKAPRRRARVRAAWHVVPIAGFTPAPLPPALAPATPGGKKAVLRLARAHRIPVDCEDGTDVIWVYPPPSLTEPEKDRHDGDHATYDWKEAMKRVNGYVADLTR